MPKAPGSDFTDGGLDVTAKDSVQCGMAQAEAVPQDKGTLAIFCAMAVILGFLAGFLGCASPAPVPPAKAFNPMNSFPDLQYYGDESAPTQVGMVCNMNGGIMVCIPLR